MNPGLPAPYVSRRRMPATCRARMAPKKPPRRRRSPGSKLRLTVSAIVAMGFDSIRNKSQLSPCRDRDVLQAVAMVSRLRRGGALLAFVRDLIFRKNSSAQGTQGAFPSISKADSPPDEAESTSDCAPLALAARDVVAAAEPGGPRARRGRAARFVLPLRPRRLRPRRHRHVPPLRPGLLARLAAA